MVGNGQGGLGRGLECVSRLCLCVLAVGGDSVYILVSLLGIKDSESCLAPTFQLLFLSYGFNTP